MGRAIIGKRVSIFSGQPRYAPVAGVSEQRAFASAEPEGSIRRLSELGYYLAKARGYRVVSAAGKTIGVLDGLRYGRHADYPDELLLRAGVLRRRERVLPFAAVQAVDPRTHVVRLR